MATKKTTPAASPFPITRENNQEHRYTPKVNTERPPRVMINIPERALPQDTQDLINARRQKVAEERTHDKVNRTPPAIINSPSERDKLHDKPQDAADAINDPTATGIDLDDLDNED